MLPAAGCTIITVMNSDAPLPIRSIGDEVAYSDNAEDTILEILSKVSDPSDGSDELAAQINDWPTRYHFSPQRSNLLRPFKITPGMTILEIGAGTGALTRYLAEQGAVVTAVEGTRARAKSVAERCRGMDQVEIICGDFKNFKSQQQFDIVLVVGVLEYAASAAGGGSTPTSFLNRVVACLGPEGVVILAIENQVGLKYLLGGKEDHLGMAWVGIEGYPGDHGVRTWGRHSLGALLQEHGLPLQRWFFPFPDYKMPSSIVSKTAYEAAQAPTLIDQWTAPPIIDYADPDRPIHDDRAAHQVFLSESLGADVANSFLVAATREGGDLGAFVNPNTLVWHFGGDRKRDRRRVTTVDRRDQDSLWVHSEALFPNPVGPRASWVTFHPDRDQTYIEGPNMEQEILEACRRGSSDQVVKLLDLWWRHLVTLEKPFEKSFDQFHPYLSASTTAILGPVYLDVQPSNFIRTDNGLMFIDREWMAAPGVDAGMVRLRALWYLARNLIISGAPLPWMDETTVEYLTGLWMGRWTTAPDARDFKAFYEAETALQLEVSGGVAEGITKALAIHGQLSRKDVFAGQTLAHSISPEQSARDLVPALKAAMDEAGRYQQSLEDQLNKAKSHTQNLETQIEDQKNRANSAEQKFRETTKEAAKHQRSLEKQIDDQKNRADQAEQHFQAAQATISSFEHQASNAADHISHVERELDEGALHIEKVENSLTTLRENVASLESTVRSKDLAIANLSNDLETAEITLAQIRSRLAEEEAWRREFENRPLIRLYRRLRWFVPK